MEHNKTKNVQIGLEDIFRKKIDKDEALIAKALEDAVESEEEKLFQDADARFSMGMLAWSRNIMDSAKKHFLRSINLYNRSKHHIGFIRASDAFQTVLLDETILNIPRCTSLKELYEYLQEYSLKRVIQGLVRRKRWFYELLTNLYGSRYLFPYHIIYIPLLLWWGKTLYLVALYSSLMEKLDNKRSYQVELLLKEYSTKDEATLKLESFNLVSKFKNDKTYLKSYFKLIELLILLLYVDRFRTKRLRLGGPTLKPNLHSFTLQLCECTKANFKMKGRIGFKNGKAPDILREFVLDLKDIGINDIPRQQELIASLVPYSQYMGDRVVSFAEDNKNALRRLEDIIDKKSKKEKEELLKEIKIILRSPLANEKKRMEILPIDENFIVLTDKGEKPYFELPKLEKEKRDYKIWVDERTDRIWTGKVEKRFTQRQKRIITYLLVNYERVVHINELIEIPPLKDNRTRENVHRWITDIRKIAGWKPKEFIVSVRAIGHRIQPGAKFCLITEKGTPHDYTGRSQGDLLKNDLTKGDISKDLTK